MDSTEQESRTFARYAVRCDARIEPLSEQAYRPGLFDLSVQDISRTGVMLRIDQNLEKGSQWRLRIIDGGYALASLPIIVRYCQALQSGGFVVGAQFIIEPHILSALGVSMHDLQQDDDIFSDTDVDFEAPT